MKHPTEAQCGSTSNSFTIQVLVKIIFTFASPGEILSLELLIPLLLWVLFSFASPHVEWAPEMDLNLFSKRNFQPSIYMLEPSRGRGFKALIETFSRLIKSSKQHKKRFSLRFHPETFWKNEEKSLLMPFEIGLRGLALKAASLFPTSLLIDPHEQSCRNKISPASLHRFTAQRTFSQSRWTSGRWGI